MILATDYASSPSGWVITFMLVLIVGMLGWYLRRIDAKQDQQSVALTAATTGLAVLIARVDPAIANVPDLTERLGGLEKDFLLMTERYRDHAKWSQTSHDEVIARLAQLALASRQNV